MAKWLQVTIHLQNGQTHSCHHPPTHKVPLEELEQDHSALHNTNFKKEIRKEMLEGQKPSECSYCWAIEESSPGNLSDRVVKSAQPWAHDLLPKIQSSSWNQNVDPTYVEVSFGNDCNLRCAYCTPQISSSLMHELKKYGPYPGTPGIDELKSSGMFPHDKMDHNPYVEAFWKWWPELKKDARVFRITGGEPLLNENTFRFLENLRTSPQPNLTLAINSNLAVNEHVFARFLNEIRYITENKLVKEFQLFTSMDTFGKDAEFIRFGLNYEYVMKNARIFLTEIKECELIFISTYNAFSVVNFNKFLLEVVGLKSKYIDSAGKTRVTLDTPYLKEPRHFSCYILPRDYVSYMQRDLKLMKEHARTNEGVEIIYESEITKFERIISWFISLEENEHRNNTRREFIHFLREYEKRKKISAADYVVDYLDLIAGFEGLLSS